MASLPDDARDRPVYLSLCNAHFDVDPITSPGAKGKGDWVQFLKADVPVKLSVTKIVSPLPLQLKPAG